MNDDTIFSYRGRAALWAALCAFHHVESTKDEHSENDAEGLLEFVWDFVKESCEEAGEPIPRRDEAKTHLKEMIRDYNAARLEPEED